MKNTDRLEDFIKANRKEFDNLDPSRKVWDRIKKNTGGTKTVKMSRYLVRVAAVLAAVVIITAVVMHSAMLNTGQLVRSNDPEINELLDTEHYYEQKVNGKMEEIRKCYSTNPEIKTEVENDLTELETMYNSLKNDLKDNISNKTVIEAMIENNRFRLRLVDSVLQQIKC